MRIRHIAFCGFQSWQCRLPPGSSPAHAQATRTHAGTGEDHARRRDPDGARSTTTVCWPRAPRSSRARRRRSRRTCVRIPCCWATRSSCRSFIRASSSADYFDNSAQFDLGIELPVRARQEAAAPACRRRKDQTAVTRSQVADNERSSDVSTWPAVHQRGARRIDARACAGRPEKLSEHAWTSARRATSAGDISEDDC